MGSLWSNVKDIFERYKFEEEEPSTNKEIG
jgi:hypothetical protein